MQWYDYSISQPFGLPYEPQYGGHSGIDLSTPSGTPLFFPDSGTIVDASYKPWGGQVVMRTNKGTLEGFLHLNDINARIGDTVQAGQIVGTSGGGIGDKLLHNGVLSTASSQSDFAGYSTGAHTHFSVFRGGSIGDFNSSLVANVNRIDPTTIVNSLKAGGPSPTSPMSDTVSQSILGINFTSIGTKIGIFLVAMAFIIGGFYMIFGNEIRDTVGKGIKAAELAGA